MLRCLLCVSIFTVVSESTSVAQTAEPITLPKPTGTYPVGTVTYEWEDPIRKSGSSSIEGDLRRIIVQMWYPAEDDPQAPTAPYSAVSNDYRHVQGNSKLRPAFSKNASACPLVLISPGRGVQRFGYSTIAEALRSATAMLLRPWTCRRLAMLFMQMD